VVRDDMVGRNLDGCDMGLSNLGRSLRTASPVSFLIAGLVVTAAVLDVAVVRLHPLSELGSVDVLRMAALITAFAVAEAIVLHVELGRNAHTLSLAEVTLVAGLFLLPASALPVARVIGGGVVLLAVRRQRPIKAMFNCSVWLLDVAAATAVFQALGGHLGDGVEALIVPAAGAAVTAAAVDSVAVNLVIAVTSREMRVGPAVRFLVTCVLGALAAAMLGVVCVAALAFSGWLLLPVALVVAAVLAGFKAFAGLHRQHTSAKALYDFTDALTQADRGADVVTVALSRVLNLLRVERAALWLDDGDGRPLDVMTMRQPGSVECETVNASDVPALVHQVLNGDGPVVIGPGEQRRVAVEFLDRYGARDAVVVTVDMQQERRGVLIAADRLGDVATFRVNDGRLLQTLAAHVGGALANARLLQRLNHDSTHDSLTGLVNRAYFQRRLDRILRVNSQTAVLLMDLDRFKEVNDTLGHHYGDLLLQQIAARLREQLRDNDLLARLGGDEFAVVMTGMEPADVLSTAARLRAALALPMTLEGIDIEVTSSIGVAMAPPDNCDRLISTRVDASAMLQQADVAMYRAKQDGTGVHIFEADADVHSHRRLALATGLRSAIEQGQLTLRYQPQAQVDDGRVVGVEALVRWEHPTYGEVGPDEFLGIAEQTGQIRELTRCVLSEAIGQCASWSTSGHNIGISVNISVRNLLEADLADEVERLLGEHELPSSQLTLEITESQLMADATRTQRVLDRLAALGVRLSIDDFGTGYSSLTYLKQVPVAEIKVDKSFVRDLAQDGNDAAIVEAIIQLAHTLQVDVVAEGVEDAAAQEHLAELSCDRIQGYHVAWPMQADQLVAWLAAYEQADSTTRRLRRNMPRQRREQKEQLAISL
jgi:diguanylate cyclase (GGDEF)-like protein